uniref:Uncharacterized protein n=1 Tax=Tanacetum cinerariifolium TaxID=118510 RepID=A0A699LCW2_TANCI|nr:hypothetical protein [Tanacetum cinerariifolium]
MLTKKVVKVVVEKIETIRVPKKKRTEIVIEETGQSEEASDTIDSEETNDEEEGCLIARQTGVVIRRRVHKESDEEDLDHSTKLKGIKTLLLLHNSCEGFGVLLEVPDGPNGSFSSESADSEGFLPTDDEASPDKSDAEKDKVEEERAGKEQLVNNQARKPSQKKRQHNDKDPPADADKDSKKRKRKDYDASSSKKSKEKEESSKEGKAPSKSSKTDKTVNAEDMQWILKN